MTTKASGCTIFTHGDFPSSKPVCDRECAAETPAYYMNCDFSVILSYVCVSPQVSVMCVSQSTLSVCVLSVSADNKRRAVGRVLFPLEGELGQAGRVLWRELETEEVTQV